MMTPERMNDEDIGELEATKLSTDLDTGTN